MAVFSLMEYFSVIPDPRKHTNKARYKLIDVVVMAVCGMLGGADDWVSIARFVKTKQEWFKTFLDVEDGTPSHDTFARIFSLIDPVVFQECFLSWVQNSFTLSDKKVIAIDGKTLRGTKGSELNSALHMVSAFCVDNKVVLGQQVTDQKSNELKAIPELLKILDVKGATVTIDAAGCYRKITQAITEKDADYVIGLKANQPKLQKASQELFSHIDINTEELPGFDFYQTQERGHGRYETRSYFSTTEFDHIENKDSWPGLKSLGMVISQVEKNGKTTTERRYYISSLNGDAEEFGKSIRAHWGIENSLHWVLDVGFREDNSRYRKDNGAANLAALRHVALNLLRQDKSIKLGVKNKRLNAGWDNDYLAQLLLNH